jgi:hypothetical protein
MSPWDELQYFRLPVVTGFLNPAAGTVLVKQDMMREVLILSNNTTGTINVNVTGAPGSGISLTVQLPILVLVATQHPGLVQASWYLPATVTGAFTTFEVSMIQWPPQSAEYPARLSRVEAALARVCKLLEGVANGRGIQPPQSIPQLYPGYSG